jgi:hypothetical protein
LHGEHAELHKEQEKDVSVSNVREHKEGQVEEPANPNSDCTWSTQVKARRRILQLPVALDDISIPNKQSRALSS